MTAAVVLPNVTGMPGPLTRDDSVPPSTPESSTPAPSELEPSTPAPSELESSTPASPVRASWGHAVRGMIFFVVAAFLLAGVLAALQPLTGIDPVLIEIVQFAPALALIAVLALRWPGPGRVVASAETYLRRLGPAVATAVGVILISAGTAAAAGIDLSWNRPGSWGVSVLPLLTAQFIGAIGEEIGWRGYLQPMLQSRFGLLRAAVIVGLIWGGWHVGVFAAGLGYALLFVGSTIAISVIFAVLTEDLGAPRVLIAGAGHFLINIGMLITVGGEPDGIGQLATLTLATVTVAAACLGMRAVSRRLGHAAP